MKEPVARILEQMVGPLVSQGLEFGIAERIARIRAFREGTYEGELCDRCGGREALLEPWGPALPDFPHEPRVSLCAECSGEEAVSRQKVKMARRANFTQEAT